MRELGNDTRGSVRNRLPWMLRAETGVRLREPSGDSRGLQWHRKVGLDTGVSSWSTVHRRIVVVHEFDTYLRGRRVDGPRLAADGAGVRALMLDFLGHLRGREVTPRASTAV